jgi:hypothetical protein
MAQHLIVLNGWPQCVRLKAIPQLSVRYEEESFEFGECPLWVGSSRFRENPGSNSSMALMCQ